MTKMKYWDITGDKAILKRKVKKLNDKEETTFSFFNLKLNGIRFLIKSDLYITDEEKQELLFIL